MLIVDDDRRNLLSLQAILKDQPYHVLVAYNGREGLESLRRHPDVRLVLMDIMMPEMNGLDAIRHLRRNPRLKDLPVIAVSAQAMEGDREKFLMAGATDYISKPLEPDRLLRLMKKRLAPA
ncbi:response regulator [Paenibacillus sp. CC-CFT747]|nr:response regulator [Paenibacillus sp. CC-CFT747]